MGSEVAGSWNEGVKRAPTSGEGPFASLLRPEVLGNIGGTQFLRAGALCCVRSES